ncbi:restriction endonuclease subunit S [Empedobacter stercoris]|nr:restriction endonuclease subunit S [Empedobacter stercoris]
MRFPEFREDWKHISLGEISMKPKYGLNSSAKDYDGNNGYLRITDIDENTNKFISKGITSPEKFSDDYLLNEGDLLFARTGNSTGKSYLYDKNDGRLYFAGFLIRFRLNPINNFKFIFYQSKLSSYDKWVKVMSMRSGQPGINSEEYSSLRLNIPTLKEQTKIANFLGAVDKQLDVLNQKKEKLNLYKKGVMQQLFSQQLRFKDDNGNNFPEWEEKTLGEVAKINKGQQLNKEHFIEGGNYKVLNGGISHSGFTDTFNRKGSVITISEGGNSCGFTSYITEDFWLGGHCYALDDLASNINDIYLYQYLKFIEPKTMRLRVGSGLPNIQKKDLSKLIITIPSIAEQNKIAEFLSAIDVQIEAVENQITKTETYKKGLLQQMFV